MMRCAKLTVYKAKCNICDIVIEGYKSDLRRHLHLKHNINLKKEDVFNHFTATDNLQDAPVITTKAVLRQKNKMMNQKRKQDKKNLLPKIKHKSIYWGSIIKTPCGSK